MSINSLFKKYSKEGGTLRFKDFASLYNQHNGQNEGFESALVEAENKYKNACGCQEKDNSSTVSQPIVSNIQTPIQPIAAQFKNASGSSDNTSTSNAFNSTTLGIKNYVLYGSAAIIVVSLGIHLVIKYNKNK